MFLENITCTKHEIVASWMEGDKQRTKTVPFKDSFSKKKAYEHVIDVMLASFLVTHGEGHGRSTTEIERILSTMDIVDKDQIHRYITC